MLLIAGWRACVEDIRTGGASNEPSQTGEDVAE